MLVYVNVKAFPASLVLWQPSMPSCFEAQTNYWHVLGSSSDRATSDAPEHLEVLELGFIYKS